MKKRKIDSLPIQVFYTSKEETNCPLLTDLLKLGKKLKQKKIVNGKNQATISFTYGKRMLINGLVQDYENIKREELLEVVDYDPVKNNLLIIGKTDPKIETTLHFMIHHAKKEIKIIIQINDKEKLKKTKQKIPIIGNKFPINSIDFIKQVLKKLRENNTVGMKDRGVLFAGRNIEEIENIITKFYGWK